MERYSSMDTNLAAPYWQRLTSDGTLDPTFGTNGTATLIASPGNTNYGYSLRLKGDNIFVDGGYYNSSRTMGDMYVAKYKSDGSLDLTFGTNGITFLGIGGYSSTGWNTLAIQPNGSILLGGNTQSSGTKTILARLKADGTQDKSFNAGSHYKVGSAGAYHTLVALTDTTFLATNCTVTETNFNIVVEKYKTIPVIQTDIENVDLAPAIKTVYQEGNIQIFSSESIDEVHLTDAMGSTKHYSGSSKVPAKENQVYIVRIKTTKGVVTKKVATF